MKHMMISPQAPAPFLRLLENEGFSLIFTKEQKNFPVPERYHADLQCFAPNEHTVIVNPLFLDDYKEAFRGTEIEIVGGKTVSDGHYPSRVAYNVAKVGNTAFCLEKALDPVIRMYLEKKGITICNVSQGYAACSVVGVGETALITSDQSIAKAAENQGFDCFYFDPESILLPGCNHGLIGGCVAKLGEKRFAVCGSEFPDVFLAFFEKYGATLLRSPGQLFDFGGSISPEGK